MKRSLRAALAAALCLAALPATATAATTVPGQTGSRTDRDGNGFPDAGVVVEGHYTVSDYYGCDLLVNYRGDFGNDAYLDSGVIANHFVCKSDGLVQTFNYQIVSSDNPLYRGNPDWAVWGTWEYHVLTQGGQGNEAYGGNGNLVRPYTAG